MKKLLLSALTLCSYLTVSAQCSDLFISQYVEGTGNNKAIEIYNPSNSPIALNNNYRLTRFGNGGSEAAGNADPISQIGLGAHIIQPHHAWVIVLDQRDSTGTGQTVMVVHGLFIKADTFLCPVYATHKTMYFNGNDALGLQKTTDGGTTWVDVDIFAQIGDAGMTSNDGTGGWWDVFPYDNATYSSPAWTLDHTLIRKHTVMQGVTVNPSAWNVSTEWDSLPKNTFDSLGIHHCDCPVNTAGINKYDNTFSVSVFPNPVNNDYFNISTSESIEMVQVYNMIGQAVLTKLGNKTDKYMTIETKGIPKGIYFVYISCKNNKTAITKLTIQ